MNRVECAQVYPEKPEQFCTPVNGISPGTVLRVAPYPVARRVETINNENHHGFEYIRFGQILLGVQSESLDNRGYGLGLTMGQQI